MAVVTTKSDYYTAPSNSAAPDPQRTRGVKRAATFSVSCLATDSSGSAYALCDIPADAILDSETMMRTDLWGFANVNLGILSSAPTALGTAAKGASLTILQPVSQAQDCLGQPAWQQLGLSAAPADNKLTIYAFAGAAAVGAGTLTGKIVYRMAT